MVCKGMRSDAELTLTHHLLHNLSHTTLSHTIFHTHAHTHHLSHTMFHRPSFAQLRLTPSVTHYFVTHTPIDTATPQENQRLETRHVGAEKQAFRARLPPILTLRCLKIDVSWEASVNFHHISQNATSATESTLCRHLTQP